MRFSALLFLFVTGIKLNFSQNYNVAAYTFHQSIVEAQQNIGKEMFEFNERATDLNLKILKFEIDRSVKFIDSLKVYNNELGYYNASKQLLAMYKDIADNEYTQLLAIIEDPDLEFKDFKEKKEKIFESIKTKTAKTYPLFNAAQQQYCTKYKIKLE